MRMIRCRHEYYCPKCGLVKEDFFDTKTSYDGRTYPYGAMPLWMSNLPQTKPAHVWHNGRPRPIWKIKEIGVVTFE